MNHTVGFNNNIYIYKITIYSFISFFLLLFIVGCWVI